MKIVTKKGETILIDNEDFNLVSKYTWHTRRNPKSKVLYAVTNKNGKVKCPYYRMHRLILRPRKGIQIDHVNGNGLDNRKCNLRKAKPSFNHANSTIYVTNTSGFKGVMKSRNKWRAKIGFDNKSVHIGLFDTPILAAKAYNKEAIRIYGEFARLNMV